LTEDVGSIRHAVKAKFPEGNINVNILILPSFRDFLRKCFKLAIQIRSASSLLLLLLEFFLVSVSELSLPISSLIELDIRCFSVKLDILSLLLADDNRVLEMDMDDNNQFMLTRLEKQMLDVAKEDINSVERVQWRLVSETILVDFNFAGNALAVHSGTNEDIVHDSRSAIYKNG
jgi:hypothetical protein